MEDAARGGRKAEEIVQVQPYSTDLTARTGLVALPVELRACAERSTTAKPPSKVVHHEGQGIRMDARVPLCSKLL